MAALQQSPVAFPPKQTLPKSLTPSRPTRLSFSSTLPSLHLLTSLRPNRGGPTMAATAAPSYASALAEIASSTGTLEATSADVEKVEKFFSDPSVKDFYLNPTIPIEKKREMVDDIARSLELQPHMENFLNVLVDSKRIELIDEIVKEFEVFYNRITDTELAVVTSVVKLESHHLAQIAKGVQRLTGSKNVRVKTLIDPSLVAGFTIRYGSSGSKLIDMSVKKQLEEIASQLDFSDISLAAV